MSELTHTRGKAEKRQKMRTQKTQTHSYKIGNCACAIIGKPPSKSNNQKTYSDEITEYLQFRDDFSSV